MNTFNDKSTIHKEDRHHKSLDTLTTKIHLVKIRRNIIEKIYIIIVRHINISLRAFYQVQKKIRTGAS